ncbi:MAG: asparagine synthase (glutamine-hydrolyzing) [Eubacteriales bacterium]|nr:asparagine synthase (glutamine-hydrolyzing) [Eubacteriales bacterium]MDD3881038.1 asparagine synthase (glutamine-hydrolyzing) [Eubacteriales bacterium]MDD4511893.1 asparagine synthase (glutamine-hydrolyzing) [Eubacteriales bacterium]
MCGIAGCVDFGADFLMEAEKSEETAKRACGALRRRGPDGFGIYVQKHLLMAHTHLALMEEVNGSQPARRNFGGECAICMCGEIFNSGELRRELEGRGYGFQDGGDAEVALAAFMEYGEKCVERFDGVFALAAWNAKTETLLLTRDRIGVKPLFVYTEGARIFFASEPQAILEMLEKKPKISENGLRELLALSPLRSVGEGIFDNMREFMPARAMTITREGCTERSYWQLKSMRHTDSYDDTAQHVRYLLSRAVRAQAHFDAPICTFLSGGLDSSVVTALCAESLREKGVALSTYSFEYGDNSRYFKPTAYQPDTDDNWAARVAAEIGTEHMILSLSSAEIHKLIPAAAEARLFPGMGDIDASLLAFVSRAAKRHGVALSGECADEVFCGYPWCARDIARGALPWDTDREARTRLIAPETAARLELEEYAAEKARALWDSAPVEGSASEKDEARKRVNYMNLYGFMHTLMERKDRMTIYSSLEIRVPFSDYRLIEYVYNTPDAFKHPGGENKGLLRRAARGLLSENTLHRPKSPYPKTHSPVYEKAITEVMRGILADSSSPLYKYMDRNALSALLQSETEVGKPFFGQLMARPQMLAWLWQLDIFLRKFDAA